MKYFIKKLYFKYISNGIYIASFVPKKIGHYNIIKKNII